MSEDLPVFDDERISAYLDDELSAPERAAFEAELEASGSLADAVGEFGAVRRTVRDLPPVEPPFGFFRRVTRRRPHVARTVARAAAVAAVAAVIALVIGLGSGTRGAHVVPALDDYFDQHASAAVSGFVPMDMADARAHAPAMGDLTLADAFSRDGVDQFRYDAGSMGMISVFVESGRCDFGKLPAGGAAMAMPSGDGWHASEMHGQSVVVLDGRLRGTEVVYTVIGAAPADAQVMVVASHLAEK